MGFVVTYSTQDTSAFALAKTISYLTTNFPLPLQNLTWSTDPTMSMIRTGPLRVNHVGPFKFLLNSPTAINEMNSGGYINVILQQSSITGEVGGFSATETNLVCTIFNLATEFKYGCFITKTTGPPSQSYVTYKITSYQSLPANIDL